MSYFAETTPTIRLIGDLILAYGIALAVCLLAWQMDLVWRIIFLVAFLLSPETWIFPGMPEPLFIFGLFCWGLLDRTNRWAGWVVVPLAALLAMAKVSFLVTGSLTVLLVASHRRSVWPVAGFIAALVILWLLLNQRIADLWRFITGALDMTSGYSSAMSLPVKPFWLACGLGILACLAFVLWRAKVPLVFKAWVAAMLFCVWKHSFVRADPFHLASFFGFAPLCAIAVGNDSQKHGLLGKASIAATWLLSACALVSVEPGWIMQGDLLVERVVENVRSRAMPDDFRQITKQRVEHERQKAQLPAIRQTVGEATVDVFGWDLAYATFNDLNYNPRPCSQSYAAFTPRLITLNSEFYRTNAPDFVLFHMNRLTPLDQHFPPSEDPIVLRDLALDYEPVLTEGSLVLLKRARVGDFRLELLAAGRLEANQIHQIPGSGEALWCQVSCRRHPLQRFFYSEPFLEVKVWRDGEEISYDAALPMVAAGFLLNPLLLTTDDIYQTNRARISQQGISFSEPVGYRIFRIETR
jgi:hypothetical protein